MNDKFIIKPQNIWHSHHLNQSLLFSAPRKSITIYYH